MSAGASGESAARAEGIRRAAIAVLAAVLAVRVLLLPVLAWNSRYVMDEFSQASFPRYLTWGFYGAFDPIKTVLYVYVYGVAHLAADRAVDLLHVARMEGALLALLVAGFTWGISRRLGRGRFQSWFAVAVLFSFTNFMERSFRIRSDTVAVFFASAAALAAVWSDGPRAAFLSGALAAAAFLSTQKAAYAVVALGLAFAASGFGAGARRAFARIAAYGGGIAAALLAYAAWFDFGQPFRVLSMVFLSPLRYAPLHDNPFYAGIRRAYVTQTLVRNPVSYGLAVIGLGLVLARFRTVPPRLRLTAVAAAVVAVLVFRHEQPWPYVFVMALPFLSLFAPDAVDWAEGRAGSGGPWVRLAAVALLLWQLPRNFAYLRVDNWVQNDVVRYAESLLAPGDRYFDAIAMVPTRDSSYPVSWEALVLARTRADLERGDDREIRRIFDGSPKVWILNYRIHDLRSFLRPFLDPSYVRVHPDVLLSGAAVSGERPAAFQNRWPGRYRLFRDDGAPAPEVWQLDGHDVSEVVFLPAGPHGIAIRSGSAPRYLLPADATLAGPLPVTAPPDDLFFGVYD